MRRSHPHHAIGTLLCLAVSCAAWSARGETPRPAPALIMSLDYDDWDLKPPAIDAFLVAVKDAGFSRVHWRVVHQGGFLYRSAEGLTAAKRLDSYGGPDFDPVRYGVRKGHELGLEIFSYVDAWENMGFLGQWGKEHPGICMMSRDGKRWPGGISYAYPEGRAFRLIPIKETARLGVDGVYLENWSWHGGGAQSEPMGLEPPVAERYKRLYGADPRTEAFDLVKLKQVQGEFYREFLVEAKKSLRPGQKLALSYAFSQTNHMVHLPILDLEDLVARRIIDVLILGLWWGRDYECWLTQEGHDKARHWADFCHRHGAQFVAYIYTDRPYVASWERFGAPGVRARWMGDHGWLTDTGLDGFTNRNVPECICAHGAPGTTDRATVSKYLTPVAEQLWSGAAAGLQAAPGSVRPLWTPARLPEDAPVVLALIPRTTRLDVYPLHYHADHCPETQTGLARQYRTLFANLGCRLELATTRNELERALATPRKHAALLLANQCWREPWVSEWLAANGDRLLDYVRRGGTLIGQAAPGTALDCALGLSCASGVLANGGVWHFARAGLPAEMAPFLPETLDLKKNVGGYTFRIGTLFKDVIERAPAAYDPSKLPGWAKPLATMPGATADRRQWPIMLAGRLGEGRILCATAPFPAREMIAINPADGPDVPEQVRLWQAIGHWLLPGRELPIDAAMQAQDRRFEKTVANLLANGGFDDGWIMGHPAYWMAEGRQAGTWIKSGNGIGLEKSGPAEGGRCLCLDAEKVASLTSMTFPVGHPGEHVLRGRIKTSKPGAKVTVAVGSNASGGGTIEVQPAADWTSFELRVKPFSLRKVIGFDSPIVPAWVEIRMPPRGTVWLDDLSFRPVPPG